MSSVKRNFACSAALFAASVLVMGAAPSPASAKPKGLLAPKSKCGGQTNLKAPAKRQQRSMRCMHRYARQKADRPSLKRSAVLQRSARAKISDILSCDDFSHQACGLDAFHWIEEFEFGEPGSCYGLGENLHMGTGRKGSVRYAMRSFLQSKLHRRALLRRAYTHVGIKVNTGQLDGWKVQVWTAHFGYYC